MKKPPFPYQKIIFICTNKRENDAICCSRGGSEAIRDALKRYVKDFGPDSKVVFIVCGGSGISMEKLDAYRRQYDF